MGKEAEISAIIAQSKGGPAVDVENMAATRKVNINTVLHMPVTHAQLSSGQVLILELVDEKGAILAHSRVAMCDVASTAEGGIPALKPVLTSSKDHSIEAQIEVSAEALVPHASSALTTVLALAKVNAIAKKVVTRLD